MGCIMNKYINSNIIIYIYIFLDGQEEWVGLNVLAEDICRDL